MRLEQSCKQKTTYLNSAKILTRTVHPWLSRPKQETLLWEALYDLFVQTFGKERMRPRIIIYSVPPVRVPPVCGPTGHR